MAFAKPGLAIFAAAFVIRALHVWQLTQSPFGELLLGDARSYDEWAERIAAGDWIGRDVFYQAPLYPYFLGALYASVGRQLLIVRLVQAALGAAACALQGAATASMVSRRPFDSSNPRARSRRAGIIAGLMLAMYAPAIFHDALIQKSVLDVFLICCSLWLLSKIAPRRAALVALLGSVYGALALTRENAFVLIAIVLGWLGRRAVEERAEGHRRAALPMAFVGGVLIVLAPVVIRNWSVGGGFYLTTAQFGPNFFIGNNPDADGTYMSLREGHGDPTFERQDATQLAQQALGRTSSPSEVSGYWRDRALAFITSDPVAWLRLLARKTLLLLNDAELVDTEAQASHAQWSAVLRVTSVFAR